MAEEKRRAKRWKLLLNIVTIIALGGLIYLTRDEILSTISNLRNVNIYALFLIIPAQALSYYSIVHLYQYLLRVIGHRVNFKQLLSVSLELNFINSVFPSGGVTGFSYFGIRMRRQGVSAGRATMVHVFRFILLLVSFQVLLLVGLLFLAIDNKANNFVLLIAGSLVTLLVIGTIGLAFIIGSKKRINSFFTYITKIINKIISVVRPKHPETINVEKVQKLFSELHDSYQIVKKDPKLLKRPFAFSLLSNAAEILTVYVVFLAFGLMVNPGAVILAYAVANFAGLISVLPGGVGIYEALMTGVLASAGIPAGESIPVIIMYRILNMSLQLPVGYYLYHRSLAQDHIKI